MQLFIDGVEIFPEHGFLLRKGSLSKRLLYIFVVGDSDLPLMT